MAMLMAAVVAIATYLLYIWFKKTFYYWKDRGVAGPTPLPLVGNIGQVLFQQKSMDTVLWDIYKKYPTEKAIGFFLGYKPTLMIRDLEMMKHVLIKDFSIFQDRGIKPHDEDQFLDNLFGTEGETWRILRYKLTPIFTSNKLKSMIPLIDKCIEEYISYVDKLVDNGKDHEIKSLSSKYTLGVIGSCAFGVDMDSFTDAPNRFVDAANKIFSPSAVRKTLQVFEFFIPKFEKYLLKIANISVLDVKLKNFFIDLVDKIVIHREGKKKLRNDLMDLLIELKEQGTIQKKETDKTLELEFTTELLAAQALVFFAAGFETSSSTMSFLMYELALHPDIQQRVYENVMQVLEKNDGKITYETITEMDYLEMCFDETLRLYPVVANLIRKCTETYKIPDTKYTVEKGKQVMISVLGLHRDPEHFKNPEVFDPERFSPENKQNIPRLAYIPFGDGPRNCIGMRFAKVQSMMGMAALISKYKLERSEKTPYPMEFSPKAVTLTSKEGIWLKITRR